MPRSGTTLVERILASHSTVASGGELNSLPLAIMEAVGLSCLQDPFKVPNERWLKVTPDQFDGISKRYLQLSLDRIAGSTDAVYFLDKLPFNYLFCGHIVKALPGAKIVHVKRELLDSAFSQYKMLFTHGYDYSYDLTELSQYIVDYQKLMSEWKILFPESIYELQYEQLVNDCDTQIDTLLSFCGLPSERSCFEFYNNPQASQTASATQVRQPIHSRSTNNWRHYLRQLAPAIDSFDKACIDVSTYKVYE